LVRQAAGRSVEDRGESARKMLSTIANSLMSKVEMNCYGFDLSDPARQAPPWVGATKAAPAATLQPAE
jgi:hypothetical protein